MFSFTTIDSLDYHDDFIETIILLDDGRLASSSNDKTINIIDINNDYHIDITMYAFDNKVPSICQIDTNTIVSFCEDLYGNLTKQISNCYSQLKAHIKTQRIKFSH